MARTRSFLQKNFVSAFRYLAAFSNTSGSNLSDVINDDKFRIFDPPPVKIRGRVGEISIPIIWSFTYDRKSEIHLMAIHCVAAEFRGLIKKKEKKVYGYRAA